MDVLIPIDRYRVDYEVGSGSPFSELDFIVLKAVAVESARDLDELTLKLYLPKRLLIESLVGLARAGWVAIGGTGASFTVTQQGLQTVERGVLPSPEVIDYRRGYVLVDRVEGRVCSNRDVTYVSTRKLIEDGIWDQAIKIERSRDLPGLDGGQVKHLLQRDKKKEWIRWVGNPFPQQQAWLHIHVDEQAGRASGIPDVWRVGLTPHIEKIVRSQLPAFVFTQSERLLKESGSRMLPAWNADSEMIELICDHKAHVEVLFSALRDAKTQVLIASAFVNAKIITAELAEAIKTTVARGVRVDLLWGYSAGKTAEEHSRTLDALRTLRKECMGKDALRFNETPTGSHAKLLAWDSDDGFKIAVGSYNWLSKRMTLRVDDTPSAELSVVCSQPGIGSEICTTIAGLWSSPQGAVSSIPDLWHYMAAFLERSITEISDLKFQLEVKDDSADGSFPEDLGQIKMRQVRDQEHETLMRDMILNARSRIAITSHKVGAKALIRLESLPSTVQTEDVKLDVVVIGGEILAENEAMVKAIDASIQARVVSAGGIFLVRPSVHAKLLVVDNKVIITSYNFLSADPFGNSADSREVGLYFESRKISDLVWSWIQKQSA